MNIVTSAGRLCTSSDATLQSVKRLVWGRRFRPPRQRYNTERSGPCGSCWPTLVCSYILVRLASIHEAEATPASHRPGACALEVGILFTLAGHGVDPRWSRVDERKHSP